MHANNYGSPPTHSTRITAARLLEKRPKFSYLRSQARALGLHAASQAADPNQASNQGTLAPHGPGQGSIRATNQALNEPGRARRSVCGGVALFLNLY